MENIRKGIKISYILMLIKAIIISLPIWVGVYMLVEALGIFGWLGDVFGGNTHSVTAGFEILFSPLAGLAGILILVVALIIFLVFGVGFAVNLISFLYSKKLYGRIFLHKGKRVPDVQKSVIVDCVQRIVLTVIDFIGVLVLVRVVSAPWEVWLPIVVISLLFCGFQGFLILKTKIISLDISYQTH